MSSFSPLGGPPPPPPPPPPPRQFSYSQPPPASFSYPLGNNYPANYHFNATYGWTIAPNWAWSGVPAPQPPAPQPPFNMRNCPPPGHPIAPQPNRIITSGHAVNDGGMPGLSFPNHLGGTGTPPGWNTLFCVPHAPIIFIRSGSIRPWSDEFVSHAANPKNIVRLLPTNVPVNTTVQQLLYGTGARNADPKKNVVTEVFPHGSGCWRRGLRIHAGEKRAEKRIAEFGWSEKRTGQPPALDYTYLYVTNDTLFSDL